MIPVIQQKYISITFVSVLKNIAAISLLIAFAAQTFNGACIKLGYAINPEAFAKYCVNKARPKLHCNGKCQMMKKMKEEEKKEQENTARKLDTKSENISSKSFYPSLITPEGVALVCYITSPRSMGFVIDHTSDFFHPPQA
jgi:hypothetical protein